MLLPSTRASRCGLTHCAGGQKLQRWTLLLHQAFTLTDVHDRHLPLRVALAHRGQAQ